MKLALLLAGGLLLAASARSAVVYIQPPAPIAIFVPVSSANPVRLDVDLNGFTDFEFTYDTITFEISGGTNNRILTDVPGSRRATALGIGEIIWNGHLEEWQNGRVGINACASFPTGSSCIGNFFGGIDYLGLEFRDRFNQVHYGWLRIETIEQAAGGYLLDWAYESEPGDPILAGAGLPGVPEPSGGLLVCAALGALAFWRRRTLGARIKQKMKLALLLAGGLLLGASARAAVVYIQPPTAIAIFVPVSSANPVRLDVDLNGFTDFTLEYDTITFRIIGADQNSVLTDIRSIDLGMALPINFEIGPKNDPAWQLGSTAINGCASFPTGSSCAGFFMGGIDYLGLEFSDRFNQVHYGWLRIETIEQAAGGYLLDWAYESEPGEAILAGAGLPGIPEPSGGLLVCAALGALACWRRRRTLGARAERQP